MSAQAPGAVLGSPLDVQLAIRVDAGETLDPDCVHAQVQIGERRLPADLVQTQLSGLGAAGAGPATATLRVRTLVRIEEPIVELSLEAGCPARLSRRYVIFADPPIVATAPSPVAGSLPVAQPGATATPVRSAAATVRDAGEAGGPVAPALPVQATPPAPARAPATSGGRSSSAMPSAAASAPRRGAATQARESASPRAAATDKPARRTPPKPRLRLDAAPAVASAPSVAAPAAGASAPAVLSPAALALVDQANEAVKAAIEELRTSQARMAALEAQVAALNAQMAAERAAAAITRQQAQASMQRARWIVPLAFAFLALIALAAWLGWRLRALDRERQRQWIVAARRQPASSGHGAEDAPAAASAPTAGQPPARPLPGAGLAPPHPPSPSQLEEAADGASAAPAQAADGGWRPTQHAQDKPHTGAGSVTQDVSAEELIDLEQQAEFFIVLGQDDAAVELLMAHLRDTGGASPLPYLKLMDVYRRLGDEDAYRQTQDRFNQRFNAHAPAWESREEGGRALDDYPVVVAALERVWPRPLDAMATLEALLFRRGGAEVFDLGAYRDLLFLYGIARDTSESMQPGEAGRGQIDLLLPLDSELARPFDTEAGGPRPPDDIRR